jgi:hypothetical protein
VQLCKYIEDEMRRTRPDGGFNIENREKPTWSFSLSAGVFGSLWDVSGKFEQNGVEAVEFLEWQCVARGDAPRLLQVATCPPHLLCFCM